jgi:hypothetical protein
MQKPIEGRFVLAFSTAKNMLKNAASNTRAASSAYKKYIKGGCSLRRASEH